MKFGKKKNSDDAAPDPAGTQAKKQSKDRKSAGGRRHKQLSSVAISQALVVVIAGAVSAGLLYFLLAAPSEARRYETQAALEADTAETRFNQQLSLLQSAVEGIAGQDYVLAALRGEGSVEDAAADLAGTLPGIEAVYLFPYGDIPRSASEPTLGFAGLDLARRAETGQRRYPDAFPRDGQWYLQIAAPVRNPQNSAVAGSVLVVFSTAPLQPLMSGVNRELGGQFSLVQSVNGSDRTVISQGSGNGPVQTRELINPNWELRYRPATAPAPLFDPILVIVLALVPAVIAAIVVWLLLGGAQRGLRQDLTVLIQWAHKVFGGERLKPPTLRWDMVASTAEVLHRLSQVVEKRVARAGESAPLKPGSGGQTTTKPAADEPLFQDKDMLDIDMLDGDDDVLGFGGSGEPEDTPDVEEVRLPKAEVSDTIFRAYDIRGIVGETLTPDIVTVIGRAIGSEAIARGVDSLCVGYDGRHSSPELADALARGIMATGCNIIHVGAVPTPVLYFATHELGTGSGVMVTGSHNPANYNGLKIMVGGETLSGDAIQKLLQRIRTGDFASGHGAQSSEDVRRAYLDRIVGDIAVAAPLKVVLDAGNGIAGELAPLLIEELGCEVIPLYCEVDGNFPNHHPDPGKPENLADLIERVKAEGADIGLAFDGDGDRLGVVTNTGRIIWPDRLLMLFARDVVSRNPGADVLYDVKCSRRLPAVISEAGGRPVMWKSGHSLMKKKMKETGALLAGEMSGHIFFGERWLGFDDGLYSAARLLEILGIEDRHCDEVFEDFPEDISTPELSVEVSDDTKFELMERLAEEGSFGDANISTIDGIRVEYTDGWGLCRASNTTPALVLRFEAETVEALERIKGVFREQLQKVAPDLVTDF
ncbi:phosphomannomutase/phosphoglucomutase [Marinobacter orientalis]|uniref:phosphomannomutase n=1 Tax=Marinobacter orientalis TaxID=1928859 RepID=A0A7Y0NK08_9GAMM|nr:phosphomannomutase/phosphoglucomutase [Marinobacter orientalis]NMT62449.1 phosphomannomutase/phosphoglucomutase [Marinobacter orientalis]TGX51148.1 phosphomannomutase/phosphoglucomutase [Marinobacter orientalis]